MRVASGRRPVVERLEGRQLLSSAAGTLDGSFGMGRGVVVERDVSPLGQYGINSGETVAAVFTRTDGKTMVVSEGNYSSFGVSYMSTVVRSITIRQFNPDGTLDLGFGTGGRVEVTPPYETGGRSVGIFPGVSTAGDEVVQQPDGKLLFAGVSVKYVQGGNSFVPDTTYAVFRTNLDGSLDTSYGTDGLATYPAGGAFTPENKLIAINAAAVQPDGKLLLAGFTRQGPSVVRLNPDGSLDLGFGAGGSTSFDPNRLNFINQIALQPDGGIVAVGALPSTINVGNTTGSSRLGLARLTPAGLVDPGFGGSASVGGLLILPVDPLNPNSGSVGPAGPYNPASLSGGPAIELAVGADGKLVLVNTVAAAGLTPATTALRRFNADGTPDATFGQNGAVVPGLVGPLALQPDGKVVIGGTLLADGAFTGIPARTTLAAARFNADGTPDASFGNTAIPGLARYNLGTAVANTGVNAVRIGPDGSILLAGGATRPVVNQGFVAVARVLGSATAGPPALAPAATPPASLDGTGRTDPAVYLPATGEFAWNPGPNTYPFGETKIALDVPGGGRAIPAPADFDGDGISDLAVYVPTQGVFVSRQFGGPDRIVKIGPKGPGRSIPTPADFDGDGRADAAVYVPARGAFLIQPSSGGPVRTVRIGSKGSIPAAADLDGDGRAEAVVYEPGRGAFRYRLSSGGPERVVRLGQKGTGQSIPVIADYTGDGRPDLGVYLPKQARYLIQTSEGGPDQTVAIGVPRPGGSIPVPGDYTGSGRAEPAVYDTTTGAFVVRPAGGGPDVTTPLGQAGRGRSIPVALSPGAYLALGIRAGGKAAPRKTR